VDEKRKRAPISSTSQTEAYLAIKDTLPNENLKRGIRQGNHRGGESHSKGLTSSSAVQRRNSLRALQDEVPEISEAW